MSFSCKFTPAALQVMLPKNKQVAEWHHYLEQVLPDFEITTKNRVAAFVAQCAHESAGFKTLQENLNYSAAGLHGVWPKRFPTIAAAQPYNRNPERIANKVYSSRMGNGDEHSGDGWKFRGRGLIQLTGRSNYTQFSHDVYHDDRIVKDPDLVLEKSHAIYSACWFWHKNKLNAVADTGDMVRMTKIINGGKLGLADRIHHFHQAQSAL